MRVTIIGCGYVGLVSGACFADFGAYVSCIDINPAKVAMLNNGELPIYEPKLAEIFARNKACCRLSFSTDLASAVTQADLVFIAVETPSRIGDGYANLSYVHIAAKQVAASLTGYTVVVNKSTVPVGTARQVARIIKETNPEACFDVASNPEFLREGSAIGDFMAPDRVVLGVESDKAEALLRKLYRPISDQGHPILVTRIESAELIKYASNAFLATKVSFINEMSNLCESIGADISEVSLGMGSDVRIGPRFLQPGPGYGGSCFPKDTTALIRIGQEHNTPTRIIEAVVQVNEAQKARITHKIRQILGGSEAGMAIAVLGLAFKPETDDMRGSPALTIIPNLLEHGAKVFTHDPKAMPEARTLLPTHTHFCDDVYETIEGVDAVVLLTEWEEYRSLNFRRVGSLMKGNLIIDIRNALDQKILRDAGLWRIGIGEGVPRRLNKTNKQPIERRISRNESTAALPDRRSAAQVG